MLRRKIFQILTQKSAYLLAMCLTLICVGFVSQAASPARNYDPHPGYISGVEKQNSDSGIEVPVVVKPADDGPTLREKIFNPELSKEFKDRYEDKFGRTEPERIYNSPNKYTYYDDLYTLQGTQEQVNTQKRDFGDYMIRRLIEYHADRYAKSDPQVRPLWEAKERLSQVKVEVQEVKFDAKYSLAGNILDLRARSPWFDTKVSLILRGATPNETIVSVTRDLSASLNIEGRFLSSDAKTTTILSKKIRPNLASTLTFSTFTGDSILSVRETLYLAGIGYIF
jgi:hypothetical protein